MPRISFNSIFALSYFGGYFSICFGYIITSIASKIITFASPIALNAFVAAGILGSLGVGAGIFALGIGIGLAYNKLADSISSLRDELLRNPPNIARCRGLSKTITIFKYLTFGLASKLIDMRITSVAFQVRDNNRSYEIMQFLVNEGIKPNIYDLLNAIRDRNGRLVRLLLQNVRNLNLAHPSIDILNFALTRRDLESISALLKHGAQLQNIHQGKFNSFIEHLGRNSGELNNIPKQSFDDLTILYQKIRDSNLANKEAQLSQLQNIFSNFINRYCQESMGHLSNNLKQNVNRDLLNDMLKNEITTLDQKTKVQELLHRFHGQWAAEIGPVLAKGQVPVYNDNDRSGVVLEHKDAPAMQKVLREPGAMSHISEFLANQDLGRTKQVAKPEEEWILHTSGPNQMPLDGAGGEGQSVALSSPQSVAIDISSEISAQSDGGDGDLRPASPPRSHAERHGLQKRSPKRSSRLQDIISRSQETSGPIESNQQPDLEGAGGNLDEGGDRRGRG